MCGIAGFLRREQRSEDGDVVLLRRMAAAVAHRGPDDEDMWAADGVGFAHRRLAVLDPGPHGRQPMRRGALIVSYNGEIYNFRELRIELEAAGARFETNTDTEVLLAAWERWGERALDRLNGMFAFALWDERRRILVLARDRIGKKPLYYAATPRALFFGSEIKAILAADVPREPDYEAIHHYLSLQYVPAPFTAFAGIRKLPAGSILTLAPGGDPSVRRWWSPPSPIAHSERNDGELKERVVETLRAAVRRRMAADVPVGVLLSGGVDSSAVASFAAEASSDSIKTFSIGFDEPSHDERRYARLVAERLGAEHHEEVVRADAAKAVEDIVWHFGEPFADPSAVPTFQLAKLASEHVTVALSGDGGDELFMGYARYAAAARRAWIERAPTALRIAAERASDAMPGGWSRTPWGGVKRRLQMLGGRRAARYEPTIACFLEAEKESVYGPIPRPCLKTNTIALLGPYLDAAPSLAAGAAYADQHLYLPDDILVKIDVAGMAFGLETRAPFLDMEMIELAASVPAERKMPRVRLKGLLKDALEDRLPEKILRRPKMGFGVPLQAWFRSDLRDFAHDLFSSEAARTRGLFRDRFALDLLREHDRWGRAHTRLWALLMLELWFREWIDRPHPAVANGAVSASDRRSAEVKAIRATAQGS